MITPTRTCPTCRFHSGPPVQRYRVCHYKGSMMPGASRAQTWAVYHLGADGQPEADAPPCPCWAAQIPEVFRA